jgi:2-isopropylmalate synthase
MDLRKDGDPLERWGVPYLMIDPRDIGRTYEAIIRINSQSGKGGVAYILDRAHGLELPKTMHPEVGIAISELADGLGRELTADEIRDAFHGHFVNQELPLNLADYELAHHKSEKGRVTCTATVEKDGQPYEIVGDGNGPINAFVTAMDNHGWKNFRLIDYRSHAIGVGSASDSAAYVQIQSDTDDRLYWGCGVDPSIEMAGLRALVSAYNRLVNRESA